MSQEDQESTVDTLTGKKKRKGGGGGGGGFLGNLGNVLSDVLSTSVDVAAQVTTGSLAGYDTRTGKVKEGLAIQGARGAVKGLDEGLGEITGRNLQRKAIMEAKDRLAVESAAKATELKNEADRKMQQDINASNYAAATRTTAASQKKNLLGGSPVKDFLGI